MYKINININRFNKSLSRQTEESTNILTKFIWPSKQNFCVQLITTETSCCWKNQHNKQIKQTLKK